MEEDIEILEERITMLKRHIKYYEESDCKTDIYHQLVEECRALENLLTRYKQLEEENKKMAKEYLVNNPGMAKYLNDNYIFKSKIESKIKVLETLQKEFPNNEELRIKIIAYKELLREE